MNFLLKKEVCGSREQCMGPTGKAKKASARFQKKKEKKKEKKKRKMLKRRPGSVSAVPKRVLSI